MDILQFARGWNGPECAQIGSAELWSGLKSVVRELFPVPEGLEDEQGTQATVNNQVESTALVVGNNPHTKRPCARFQQTADL